MFLGRFTHSIDDKSRLTIPSRFREALGTPFYATVGLENSIFLYPQEEWDKTAALLKQNPLVSADARAFNRLFYSGAVECEPDKQGRILLPPNLIKHAHIDKEAIIIGVSDRVEIWSLEEWERYEAQVSSVYEKTAESLDRNSSLGEA